jgi:hypothetical protein
MKYANPSSWKFVIPGKHSIVWTSKPVGSSLLCHSLAYGDCEIVVMVIERGFCRIVVTHPSRRWNCRKLPNLYGAFAPLKSLLEYVLLSFNITGWFGDPGSREDRRGLRGKLVHFPLNPLQSSWDPLVTKSTLRKLRSGRHARSGQEWHSVTGVL